MDTGDHKFPFRFQLPETKLPHPFEGEYGHVRYKATAIIDRPRKFNHEIETFFDVIGAGADLNTMPNILVSKMLA